MVRRPALYPGTCKCGGKVRKGDNITYDGRIIECPACKGGATAQPGQAAAPQTTQPVPTSEEAHATLVGLTARLDPYQRQIAAWRPGDGNLRVVAGAGSGKTATTVDLVGQLVEAGVRPADIIATTFTRKAAGELQERVARVLPPGALESMRVGTFHSIAGRIVSRIYPDRFPRSRNMDSAGRAKGVPNSAFIWNDILGWAGPSGLPGTGEEGLGLPDPDGRAYALAVDVVRSRPHASPEALDAAMVEAEESEGLPYLARAWGAYKRCKEACNAWDFADVIAALHAGLAAGLISDGARVVIVDEAQDNSAIFIEIARLLAANARGEVILVGDVRQSIYGWRGAAPAMFRDADVTISAKTLELPINYRSGAEIVALGNRVATGKTWTLGADTLPGRDARGAVTVTGYADVSEEASAVAAEITTSAATGTSLDAIAILARTNAQAGAFEAALVSARVPCVVVGGTPFFARREVADFLAYARLTVADDLDAVARIANRPKRMLGRAFTDAVRLAPGATAADKVAAAADGVRASGQRAAARELSALLSRLRAMPWVEATGEIARLLTPPTQRGGAADEDRGGLLAMAAALAASFDDAGSFLAFAARCQGEVVQASVDDALPPGRVVISTIHKAKGMEWGTVYVSATKGIFPHARCDTDARRSEEERLFYVAVTRAKDALRLTWAEQGTTRGSGGPSPFLDYVVTPGTDPEGGPGGGVEAPALLTEREVSDVTGEPPSFADVAVPSGNAGDNASLLPDDAPLALPAAPSPFLSAAPDADADAWATARGIAEHEGAEEPIRPLGAARYVEVSRRAMDRLLAPLGFAEHEESGQRVFTRTLPAHRMNGARGEGFIKVYTSIPPGEEAARGVGEDSLKVAALWRHTAGLSLHPLHRKLPYACRTRGWRTTLLDKIEEVSQLFAANPPCRRCGAPTVDREGPRGAFKGCVRFRECRARG